MDILQSVMDSASHAMFTMDRQGIVTHINRQAKERFGLFNHSIYSHPAGRLEPGDIVFIDEIHRMAKTVEEYLYSAMEDFAIDILIDQGPNARSVRLEAAQAAAAYRM